MESSRTDAELLVASRNDADAFGELYRRHSRDVLSFFGQRTFCAETAADLTAETFCEAFRCRGRFVDQGKPAGSWLYTIARRQFSHYLRTEAVSIKARKRLGVERPALTEAEIERIDDAVAIEDLLPSLRAVMADLPESQRQAVQLRVLDDRPFREVAAVLGCSQGAARVRVSRALLAAANQLGEVDD